MRQHIIKHGLLPMLVSSMLAAPAHGQAEAQPMDHSTMGKAAAKKPGNPKPDEHAGMQHATGAEPGGQPAAVQSAPAQPDHGSMGHMPMDQDRPSAGKPADPPMATDQHTMDHSGMDHGTPQDASAKAPMTGHQRMDMNTMQPGSGTPSTSGRASMSQQAMQHDGMDMGAMQMGPMQGGKPPPDARDPAAYNEGARPAGLPGNAMADMAPFGRVMIDKLEAVTGDGERGQNIEAEAWYGGDYNKAWLKADGERRGGRLEAMRTELLWDRTFSPFWSTQLGMRHDTGGGASRNWLAAGVRGLAPYWFDVEATAYWRSGGEFAGRVQVAYELLFTQRLILEPELELNVQNRRDRMRGTGTGLTDGDLGLRLRYEIRRQFAPYIGVTWNRKFGSTADLARASGIEHKTVQAVIGLRVWY